MSDPESPTPHPTNLYCKDLEFSIFLGDNFRHFKDLPIAGEFQQNRTMVSKDGIVRCVTVSSDGRMVACGDLEGNLRVYNIELKDYPRIAFIEAHNGEILSADFVILDDGTVLLASGSRDRLVHIFKYIPELGLGKPAHFVKIDTLDAHKAAVKALAFAKRVKSTVILTADANKTLIMHRLSAKGLTFEKVLTEIDKTSKILSLDVSPHNSFFATG